MNAQIAPLSPAQVNILDMMSFIKTPKAIDELNEILAANTGKPYDVVAADTERDYYMSAQEAAEYGLIDAVITNR